MSHKVGIWIDHKKAVIVSASANHVTARTMESEVGPHTCRWRIAVLRPIL